MVWKALEALGMLSEALGSFDVNTVCPLPGSWINHVECIFPGKGIGPGFSFSCRPSALDRTLNLYPRQIFPVRAVAQGSLCVVGLWP